MDRLSRARLPRRSNGFVERDLDHTDPALPARLASRTTASNDEPMNVTCDREKLREGLSIVNTVIPAKSPKAVVENVCLVATDDALELVGTDLEVSVRYRIEEVQVDDPGPCLIPSRVAADFVRDLSGDKVHLSTSEGNCVIESGSDSCELVTADASEFPVVPRFEEPGGFTMQGGTFLRLVGQTAFAAAREPGRYAMHGVLTEVENEQLRLVATDGRRLSMATSPVECREPSLGPAIIPTKGMQLFGRVISDPLDSISVQIDERQVGMRCKHAQIFARLIEGDFPRYSAVIPTETAHSMEASKEVLQQKLRLVANVTGDEARAVKLKLGPGQLELFGRSVGRGEARAHMEVEYRSGDAEIAFNPDYVLDGLKTCEGETLRLEFNERTSPGKFTLGENHVYIVMPITVDT